jgi:hypothetical protein
MLKDLPQKIFFMFHPKIFDLVVFKSSYMTNSFSEKHHNAVSFHAAH